GEHTGYRHVAALVARDRQRARRDIVGVGRDRLDGDADAGDVGARADLGSIVNVHRVERERGGNICRTVQIDGGAVGARLGVDVVRGAHLDQGGRVDGDVVADLGSVAHREDIDGGAGGNSDAAAAATRLAS